MEERAARQRCLIDESGPREPDWRLWITLVRSEPAHRPFLLGAAAPALSD